jgi:hypothetical protein
MHNETRVCISQVTEMAQYAANNKNALDRLRVVVLGIRGGVHLCKDQSMLLVVNTKP